MALREVGDAFDTALSTAAEAGAGTLVWVRRFDLVEAAVVLEPEQPLLHARRVLYAGMNAAADALANHCPPEKPIAFAWPDTIMLDGGLVGGMRLGWPDGTGEHDVPQWMVLGLMLRSTIHASRRPRWTGPGPDSTSLEDEGFAILSPADIISSYSRHLMAHIDRWLHDGFKDIGREYLARLMPEPGARFGIDMNGDLLVRKHANRGAERRSLTQALTLCAWLDHATGEPLL
jgi:biotin-(acetyl-CoA carboxylase) ligase